MIFKLKMKNLQLWDISIRDFCVHFEEKAVICHGRGDGGSSSDIFVCGNNLILCNFDENCQKKWFKDVSEYISPENSPVNICYLSLQNSLCIGFANGELLAIGDSGVTCETVGIFNTGLLVN